MTETDQRILYKAFRSAHDGVCPQCGGNVVHLAGYKCNDRDCSFSMSSQEVREFRGFGAAFMGDVAGALHRSRNPHPPDDG